MSIAQEVNSKAYDLTLKALLSRNVSEVDVQKAKKMEQALFIDAREKKEFEVSHIQDAIWVGYEQQDLSALEKVDRNTSIVVYCSVGYRSEKTVEKLNQKGFKNVYNLYGGIFEWVNQGEPIYRDNKKTNQIHAYNRVWGVWLNKGEKVYE